MTNNFCVLPASDNSELLVRVTIYTHATIWSVKKACCRVLRPGQPLFASRKKKKKNSLLVFLAPGILIRFKVFSYVILNSFQDLLLISRDPDIHQDDNRETKKWVTIPGSKRPMAMTDEKKLSVPPPSPDGGGKQEAKKKPAEERVKEAGFAPPTEQMVAAFKAALGEKVTLP